MSDPITDMSDPKTDMSDPKTDILTLKQTCLTLKQTCLSISQKLILYNKSIIVGFFVHPKFCVVSFGSSIYFHLTCGDCVCLACLIILTTRAVMPVIRGHLYHCVQWDRRICSVNKGINFPSQGDRWVITTPVLQQQMCIKHARKQIYFDIYIYIYVFVLHVSTF